MNVLSTLLISAIPAIFGSVITYLVSMNQSKTQLKTISEQNKADIEKIVEEHKINLEAIKEKHKLEMEIKERDHQYQVELIKLQHDNELIKANEGIKNQLASSAMSNIIGGMFTSESAITKELGTAIQQVMSKSINDNLKK